MVLLTVSCVGSRYDSNFGCRVIHSSDDSDDGDSCNKNVTEKDMVMMMVAAATTQNIADKDITTVVMKSAVLIIKYAYKEESKRMKD